MRVALFISPAHTVPPELNKILAPWWIVRDVADGLVDRGHDVTVFAGKGSVTRAKVIDGGIEPFDDKQKEMTEKQYQTYATFLEQRLASILYEMSVKGAFDIIGNHLVQKTLPFARFTKAPTVYTLHDPLTREKVALYRQYNDIPAIHYVAISESQKKDIDLPFAGVVYNGIQVSDYKVGDGTGGHLIAVGRIRKEKGFTDAIDAARIANKKLILAGEYFPQYPEIKAYWEESVKPRVDGERVVYYPVIPREQLLQLYQQATALLFPIHWEEPFGLVMIEAMACGTPVIAYNRGSVAEIIKDGVTGFIINEMTNDKCQMINGKPLVIQKTGIEGLVEAIKRISEIDRAACRKHVEEHFTIERMVEGYERVYRKVLGK